MSRSTFGHFWTYSLESSLHPYGSMLRGMYTFFI